MQNYTSKEAKIKIRNLLKYINRLKCNIKLVFDGEEAIEFIGFMRNNRESNGDSFCTIICETYWKYEGDIYVVKSIKEYLYSYEDKKGIEYEYNESRFEYLESKIIKSHMHIKPIEYYDQLFDLFHGFTLRPPSNNLIENPDVCKVLNISDNIFISFFIENITDLLSSSVHDTNLNKIFTNLESTYGVIQIYNIIKNLQEYVLEKDLKYILVNYLKSNSSIPLI